MKPCVAITALGAAAVAAAPAPLEGGQDATTFNITGLSMSCIPHSTLCLYDFNATVSSTVTATCSAAGQTNPLIGSVALTACAGGKVSFSHLFVVGGDGSVLTVAWAVSPGRNMTGRHAIPSGQIDWVNKQSPTGTVQAYIGPGNVTITDVQSVAVEEL